ncbi:MAG: SDR family oxidoreductase [Bacteroidota bacterium]
MDLQLNNKVVLVTASSTGIGRAVAEAFAQEGCQIAICARTKEDLVKAATEIKKMHGIEPLWCVCDINVEKDILNTLDVVRRHFGDIDILVNNSGGPVAGIFENLTDEHWQAAFEQVLLSVVRFSRGVIQPMKEKRWGRIINITSIAVKQPMGNLMLSNSLRNAITGLSKTLSNELSEYNITVNNIAPGYTLTSRLYELAVARAKVTGGSHEHTLAEMAKEVPLNRLARPDEIAAAVVFLASEKAGYITGTTLQVDGGLFKGIF